jgi:hypothetical protein
VRQFTHDVRQFVQRGLSKSPQLISAFALSAFVIKYTLFTSARLPGNGFSIR